jgi:hypothetical protein
MNLIISPHKPSSKASFVYDWESIADGQHRGTARVLIESLAKSYVSSIKEVEQIARRYTNVFSKTVWSLKQQLPHGLFRDVCRQALNLNDHQIGAYAEIGRHIEQGAVLGKALEMVDMMEPRAASKFLKADQAAKDGYVATFEQTGRAPSQRDFSKKPQGVEKPLPALTTNPHQARLRMREANIRMVDVCYVLAESFGKMTSYRLELRDAIDCLRRSLPD